jgi:flagellar biosynthesis/type III secretory pathway M-ring protein FliF/YscJ
MDDDENHSSFGLASQLQVIAILMLVVVLLWFELRLIRIERKQAAQEVPQPAEDSIKPFMKDPELWKTANQTLQDNQK